jgi:hypothetical protein
MALIALHLSNYRAGERLTSHHTLEPLRRPQLQHTSGLCRPFEFIDLMEAALVYEMTSFEFSNTDIAEHEQTAVAFVQYRQDGKLHGVSRSGDWLITDVWRRNETACQVVARSAFLKTSS